QHPDVRGVGAVLAILLADHPVIGVAGLDQPPEGGLGLAVGAGDRIERARSALVEGFAGAAEPRQRHPRRLPGQFNGEQFVLGHAEPVAGGWWLVISGMPALPPASSSHLAAGAEPAGEPPVTSPASVAMRHWPPAAPQAASPSVCSDLAKSSRRRRGLSSSW